MKKLFIIGSLSLAAALIAAEIWAHWVVSGPPVNDRIIHPYISLGGFAPQTNDHPNPESYETVGYQKRGWLQMPTFPFGLKVDSPSERGRFLFQGRDATTKRTPSSKNLRFFVLGGSVALGGGSSSPETRWFIQLESKLERALGATVQSIPAATPSQVTTQQRIVQNLYVIPNRPSAMIILDGINDCQTYTSGTRPGDPYGQGIIYKRFESPLFQFLSAISKHSSLIKFLFYREVMKIGTVPAEDQLNSMKGYADSVANVYYENIAAMKHRCDLEKIPCYFFLQPVREITSLNRNPGEDFSLNPLVKCYEEIRNRRKNYPYLHDLTNIFDKIEHNLFSDSAHFNDEGHEIVAREIAKVVLESRVFGK